MSATTAAPRAAACAASSASPPVSAAPATRPTSLTATSRPATQATATSGMVMAPHSVAGGHGSHAHANRFSTMIPLGQQQGAIPASSAPDNKPDANRVYAGMNVGIGREQGRQKFWSALLEGAGARVSKSTIDTSQLCDAVLSEIDMELEPGHFSRFIPALAAADFAALKRILQREAAVNERETLGIGYSHLAARIFLACDRDESRALDMLCLVAARLRTYESDVPLWSLLRNDVLHLTDLLLANPSGVQLCQHFNSVGFDLVDLSDVVVTWFGGLFCASAFPTEFCLRCIDLLLLPSGGVEQLLGVLYGLLHVFQMKLLECPNSESLFTSLQDLPSVLTKAQISEIFAQAYCVVWVPSQKAALRQPEVEWAKIIDKVSGTMRFQSTAMMKAMGNGAGDAIAAATSLLLTHSSGAQSSTLASSSPTRPTAATTAPGHARPASMTFNLGDYSPDALKAGATPQDGAPTTVVVTAAESLAATPAVLPTKRYSIAPMTAAPALPASTTDPTLLAELSSASSGNKSAAQLQTLLERALKELRVQQRAAAAAAAAVASSGAPTTAASQPAAPASASTGPSTITLGVRCLAEGIHQIPALEIDRTSAGSAKRVVPSNGIVKYSELLTYQLYPVLCMSGYLMKSRAPSKLFKRTGPSGFFGNLHRRFFLLQGSFLSYFKTHHDTKPTRDESVDLRSCVATKIKNHEMAPFAMSIARANTSAVVYLLFAENEATRDVWLECLAQATKVPILATA